MFIARRIRPYLYYRRPLSTMKVPFLGDGIDEGTLIEWNVALGDVVKKEQTICVIETDKVTVDVLAEEDGTVTQLYADVDDTVEIDEDLIHIDTTETGATSKVEPVEQQEVELVEPLEPVEQQLVEQQQVEQQEVEQQEVEQQEVEQQEQTKRLDHLDQEQQDVVPTPSRSTHTKKTSRMRRKIAERLIDSQNRYAMLSTFNEINMSALIEYRQNEKENFLKEHGVPLGYMGVFAKACAIALQEYPVMHAQFQSHNVLYHDYVDISVAVSSPRGLLVPVIRDCHLKSVADIECEVHSYANAARNDELDMKDMEGGTFTITNGGIFGSQFGTPMINPPQSAILGTYAIKEKPIVCRTSSNIVSAPMMYAALTYDHRLIDGKDAGKFLQSIVSTIENPQSCL